MVFKVCASRKRGLFDDLGFWERDNEFYALFFVFSVFFDDLFCKVPGKNEKVVRSVFFQLC